MIFAWLVVCVWVLRSSFVFVCSFVYPLLDFCRLTISWFNTRISWSVAVVDFMTKLIFFSPAVFHFFGLAIFFLYLLLSFVSLVISMLWRVLLRFDSRIYLTQPKKKVNVIIGKYNLIRRHFRRLKAEAKLSCAMKEYDESSLLEQDTTAAIQKCWRLWSDYGVEILNFRKYVSRFSVWFGCYFSFLFLGINRNFIKFHIPWWKFSLESKSYLKKIYSKRFVWLPFCIFPL